MTALALRVASEGTVISEGGSSGGLFASRKSKLMRRTQPRRRRADKYLQRFQLQT